MSAALLRSARLGHARHPHPGRAARPALFRGPAGPDSIQRANPLAHFARLQMSFPKSLLGYQPPAEADDDRKSTHPDRRAR